jgi:thioesterase domain-containing protein
MSQRSDITFTTAQVEALERTLYQDIPLSVAMGVTVRGVEANVLILHAPLAPNHNHKGTLFGGSVYCLAVLAAWSWLYVNTQAQGMDGHIVIQGGSIEYPLPVSGDGLGICQPVTEEAWARFAQTFARHGKARINVSSVVRGEGGAADAARFAGVFVLQR